MSRRVRYRQIEGHRENQTGVRERGWTERMIVRERVMGMERENERDRIRIEDWQAGRQRERE